ncbi:MAG: site-2 protease family protein [Chitinispirillaceae bacterium]
MFGRRIRLFKLLGFEVNIDLSWIIIAVLIVWSLAQGVFPLYYEGLASEVYWAMGILGAIGLFVSIIVHEFCHSLVARRYGLPMKGITLFIFGGVAEMEDEPPSAKAEFLMALAGPVASVIVGFSFWGVLEAGRFFLWPLPVLIIFNYLRTINLVLAVFNMLPAFPLDGGRVFRSVLWGIRGNILWATKVASMVGSGFGLTLIALGVFSVFAGGIVGGLWWALIGLFIRSASKMSYDNIRVKGALEGEPLQRFLEDHPVTVSADTTVDHLIEDYIYKYNFNLYPVLRDGEVRCISVSDVKNVPQNDWANHRVEEYAKPCSSENSVLISENAMKAFSIMNRTGNSRLMVLTPRGDLLGTVNQKDMVRYLTLKMSFSESERDNEKKQKSDGGI